MRNKFLTGIRNVKEAMDSNRLVVFAGSGISVDSGLPDWSDLINAMKTDLDISQEEDYLKIAQMYYNERGPKEYLDRVRSILNFKNAQPNNIHRQIFKLKPLHIITTNYDNLLEQVVNDSSLFYAPVKSDKEFPYSSGSKLLVKIHGDLEDGNIILKEDDYIKYEKEHPLMKTLLESVFSMNLVLFIGYSLSDMNLKIILQHVRDILGNDFQQAYLLSTDEEMSSAQRNYFEKYGVKVLNFFDVTDADENYILNFLDGENAFQKTYNINREGLSTHGIRLIEFLHFITKFNYFDENNRHNDVVDQMYSSLLRFSEVNFLPPDFIANLFPFNTSENYSHGYRNLVLNIKTTELKQLFQNDIIIKDGDLTFNDSFHNRYQPEEIGVKKKKLEQILRSLNRSLIREIEINGIHFSITLKPGERCDCPHCRWNRFDYFGAWAGLKMLERNENASLQSLLKAAYMNYKFGRFLKAYDLYTKISVLALRKGQYISYYISIKNTKFLKNLIAFYDRPSDENLVNELMAKFDEIDLDRLLIEINSTDKDKNKLLKYIRNDTVKERTRDKVSKNYESIRHAYDKSENGGDILGPYYPQDIETDVSCMLSFYSSNYLIGDIYSDFVYVYDKAIEGFLVSYSSDERYPRRLKWFTSWHFFLIVKHGKTTEIKKHLTKYKIVELNFKPNHIGIILDYCTNFLLSFVTDSADEHGVKRSKTTFKQHLGNSYFGMYCRDTFDKMLLLLSCVHLPDKLDVNLADVLIKFLQQEEFLMEHNYRYLASFIKTNDVLFSKGDLEQLLEAAYSRGKYIDKQLLHSISSIFRIRNYGTLSNDDKLYDALFSNNTNKRRYDLKDLIRLWSISGNEIKNRIAENVIETLDSKFTSSLYHHASFIGIIDYNLYFDQYWDKLMEVDFKPYKEDVFFSYSQEFSQIISAVYFLYQKEIFLSTAQRELLECSYAYVKFYLDPENFDFSNFEFEWLRHFPDDQFVYNRLRNIPQFKTKIESTLKDNYDGKLGEFYLKTFVS